MEASIMLHDLPKVIQIISDGVGFMINPLVMTFGLSIMCWCLCQWCNHVDLVIKHKAYIVQRRSWDLPRRREVKGWLKKERNFPSPSLLCAQIMYQITEDIKSQLFVLCHSWKTEPSKFSAVNIGVIQTMGRPGEIAVPWECAVEGASVNCRRLGLPLVKGWLHSFLFSWLLTELLHSH